MLAAGLAFLLGAGELDISVGSNVILSSVVGGKVMVSMAGTHDQVLSGEYPHLTSALIVGILVTLAAGVGFGLVNAFIVCGLGVNSFIATLGTLGIGQGLALVISDGTNIEGIPGQLQTGFGVKDILGAPLPAVIAVVVALALWLVLRSTRYGMRTLAIGSSRAAASRAGVGIDRHLVSLFALIGLLAGIAGVFDLSRFATTNLSGHQTDALSAIAGAVIGGTKLFGGRASVIGAVFGATLAVILETGLVIQGLSPFYQLIAVGVVLIVAVYIRGSDESDGKRRGAALRTLTTRARGGRKGSR
jgi:ribose transport system permease protein